MTIFQWDHPGKVLETHEDLDQLPCDFLSPNLARWRVKCCCFGYRRGLCGTCHASHVTLETVNFGLQAFIHEGIEEGIGLSIQLFKEILNEIRTKSQPNVRM